ncbi:MAG TPA: glutamine--scyllo-inositol aminotransferase [Myxococcales bacterium]|nr:glutamine--scyllo-inositol aminotransferase [Myxococcales bacterium]HAN31356.1 glutamine--scyllo-inositol aminotransferase [Myxococcales bacterium]
MIPIIKPWLGEQEAEAARDAILSGWVAQGPRVGQFERAVCDRVGATEGLAVSSCTTGLHLALIGAEVGPGDDVVVPSLSFIATANSVSYCGANSVFADVCPVTQNVTAQTVSDAITPKTKAVLLVHQVGMPADIDAIRAVCDAAGAVLIEDAACAIGSTYKGAEIGGHSPFVVYSFHPRKVITTGEGGMVMVQDKAIADRLRILRQHAMSISDVARHSSEEFVFESYPELGYNYRMTDIQAAIGMVQLGKLSAVVSRRRQLAQNYHRALEHYEILQLPVDPSYGTTNYQSYCIKLRDGGRKLRDRILQGFKDRQIGGKRGIMAAHLEGAFSTHRQAGRGSLPESERWTDESFVLPMYHHMTQSEQAQVVEELRVLL